MNCGDCGSFVRLLEDHRHGRCHHCPPPFSNGFPVVNHGDWCQQWVEIGEGITPDAPVEQEPLEQVAEQSSGLSVVNAISLSPSPGKRLRVNRIQVSFPISVNVPVTVNWSQSGVLASSVIDVIGSTLDRQLSILGDVGSGIVVSVGLVLQQASTLKVYYREL